ncbi:MAG TPA: type VII secretion target [Jatrophihabitans sp.]
MTDIDVSPEAIKKHADEVDTFMQDLSAAVAQGTDLMDLRAFGIIGETWAGVLQLWTNTATELVNQSAWAGHSVAQALRDNAANYETSDQQHADHFAQIHANLAGGR